jgi:Cu-Zn family superoxide dismutase
MEMVVLPPTHPALTTAVAAGPTRRRIGPGARSAATVLAVGMLAAGCGGTDATGTAAGTARSAPTSAPDASTGSMPGSAGPDATAAALPPTATVAAAEPGAETFLPYKPGAKAVTYDPAVVPAGATAKVTVTKAGAGVKVRLSVTGMIPRRAYGAHLHTDPCDGTPAHAGPHYQNLPDPKAVASPPSVDPKFANRRNEVWLDFTADAQGTATVTATQTWPFDEINPPRSLIVHAERTSTVKGKAGTAGPRAACVTVPL